MPASLSANSILRSALVACVLVAGNGLVTPALAQDSAFLACARFEDRGQRIACLEDALEAAVAAPGSASSNVTTAASAAPAPASAVAPAPAAVTPTPATTANAAPPAPADTGAAVSSEERSLLDRIRNFGRSAAGVGISTDASGQEQLHDTITTLEKRNNLWVVTLLSGQVWRQTYARNLLLREGDEIVIDQEGVGNAYR
ncbi:MAG: hypothetical protein ACO3PV_08420, partial [Pseudohongiellaceae bacterium]